VTPYLRAFQDRRYVVFASGVFGVYDAGKITRNLAKYKNTIKNVLLSGFQRKIKNNTKA
jgi:nitrogenase subunit NifH